MGVQNFQGSNSNRRPKNPCSDRRRGSARLLSTTALVLGTLCFAVSGCSVQEHKNGEAENVHVHTPIGGLDIRTNTAAAIDVGLPVYPGAIESGEHGDDSGSADIHMNFGKWQLHVKAVEYRSNDLEEKVIAFYKTAMGAYGDVITCKDKVAIGEPSTTRQGLTCANDHEYDVTMDSGSSGKHLNISSSDMSGNIKLLAGSTENQHIIEFTPTSNGTKFSIVVVQLPHKDRTD
ncbi:MAG: hypothetical protein ACLQMO_00015 [Acidobacteriaceae bacterium]